MTGNGLVFENINRNMTIMQLKERIEREHGFPVSNQRIMYRPGPSGINPLDDNSTVLECCIGYTSNPIPELDLLVQRASGGTVIRLSRTKTTEELVKFLSTHEGEINFGEQDVSRAIIPLCEALKQNTTVDSLNLSQCIAKDRGAIALADMLKVNNSITNINLAGNYIENAGALALADMLRVNTGLRNINLRGIKFNGEAATLLAEALRLHPTLTNINLHATINNPESALQICNALMVNTSLTHINLGMNKIEGASASVLAEALRHNTTLTHVNLYGIHLSDEEGIQICNALRDNDNTHIIEIDLRSNGIGLSDASRAALQNLRTARPLLKILI